MFLTIGNAISGNSGISFDPDMQLRLDEAVTQGYTAPTQANKIQQNILTVGLKDDLNWSAMDVAWLSVNSGSEEFGFLNIKSPGTYRLTKSGTTVWISNGGSASNGTDGYYNTGYNPSTNGVGFLRDSNSFSVYYLTDSLQANRQGLGAWLTESSGQGYFVNPRHTGDVIRSQNNNGTTTSTAITSSIGLTTIVRIASTEYRVYKNGVHIATITATSAAIVNLVCYLMAQRQTTIAAGFDPRPMGWWSLGGPMTNYLHLFNRLNTYMMNPEGTASLLNTDILFGHSNAVGWTTAPITSLPAPLQGPITNALIYNPTSKVFETLDAGTNNQANSSLYHGVEITYMNTLVNAVGQRGLIKFAAGGTIMHNSNAADSWHVSNTSLAGLYKGLLSRINQARCAQALRIKNVIMYLGINDAQNESYANEYEVSLTLFINTLRSDLQLPNLNFVLIKDHSNVATYTFIDTIRTAIDNVAAAMDNVYVVDSDPYDPTTLHPNSAAYQAIGTDAANITKDL